MDILTWLMVGLIAGVLASLVMGGSGYGLIGDIVIGIVGAFIGGLLFARLGIEVPFSGLASTIFVAFIGALVLLFLLRLIRRSTYARSAPGAGYRTRSTRGSWWRRRRR